MHELSSPLPGNPAGAGMIRVFGGRGLAAFAGFAVLLAATLSAHAQAPPPPATTPPSPAGPAGSNNAKLPDEPAAQIQHLPELTPRQTNRILGIIPNFRSVNSTEVLPPQSAKEKFINTSEDSFDYSSAIIPALLAGYGMGRNSTPEFGHGAAGYGRYFWHSALDQTSENYLVEFVFPVITHEDNRYYTMGHGGFLKRTGYSLSRVVVTRDDDSRETFNISEVVGAGSSAGLSNLYYPAQERTFSNTAQNWGLDVGIDAISFMLKEFWPDVNNKWFHMKPPPAE